MTTGIELIKKEGRESFAITSPLLKKADGTKFGKTEDGNIWLDSNKTSVYKFFQFWLNISDEDAKSFIRIFTFFDIKTIEELERQHEENRSLNIIQKALAKDITIRIHSEEEFEAVLEASQILFKKGDDAVEGLKNMSEDMFNDVFTSIGVPQKEISIDELENGMTIIDILFNKTGFLNSNSDARRSLNENSISVNRKKVDLDTIITENMLINGKYVLLQRGKTKFFVAKFV